MVDNSVLSSPLRNFSILVIDDSQLVRQVISRYLEDAGANVLTAEHGAEALEICKQHKIDILLIDINMPVMDGFELLDQLASISLKIPSIMITHTDIDSHIEQAIAKDVGNILSKPINKGELISLCQKIVTGRNIFGLKNYMDETAEFICRELNDSNSIHPMIEEVVAFGLEKGMLKSNSTFLSIIIDEVLSNAIYHAHGFTEQKLESKPVMLNADDKVDVCYGCGENVLGISVTDYKGKLTKKKILGAFKEVVDQKKLIEKAEQTGFDITARITRSGRGLQMIRLMSNRYYFNIQPDRMTEVIILFDLKDNKPKTGYSSIKINEVH
ncbi:MAG: response regulator [Spirochaetales bacterium]|nr:response regulator [Spirochaetales bacterium]